MTILRTPRRGPAVPALSIAAVMLCAPTLVSTAWATDPIPIAWRSDYGGALEEARATNRLVWIQFSGPWCPNCVRMERDSFPDADIIEHSQRSFIPLKLRSDVHEQLALAFNLSGLPATVLVTPDRQIVAVHQGYLGPDELDGLLSQSVATWHEREASAKKKEAEAEKDGETADAGKPGTEKGKKPPRLALAGYCPVTLRTDRKLVAGRAEHTVEHDGQVYRFAGEAQKAKFRQDPKRFIPVNRGNCPVTQVEQSVRRPGSPRWGLLYEGRLYVFASDEARRRFREEPSRYATVDVAEQGFCPHCLGESGLLVRGDPKFELTRDGRRYWFPDETHRAAFAAASPAASSPGTSRTADAAGGLSATSRR
ncbi:MAG: thioredoxin family protein [Isosphaeraceae bacterium]